MSRVGKLPIKVSKDLNISINDGIIVFKKGSTIREYNYDNEVTVELKDDSIIVGKVGDDSKSWGLHRNNINNIVIGLTEGFKNVLEFNGVGYKANVVGDFLILSLGYSHDIAYSIPEGIKISIEKPNLIVINGYDKELVGRVGSQIISFRKTEPYKGKGIKKVGQYVVRKEGKKK